MQKYTTIDAFMHGLDEKQIEQVALLRTIIKTTHPDLVEHIKWNSPSYVLNGSDRVTLSVRPGYPISVIIHMDTARTENKQGSPIMSDSSKLIVWKSDIRGVISFNSVDDIRSKKQAFASIIDQWLKIDT